MSDYDTLEAMVDRWQSEWIDASKALINLYREAWSMRSQKGYVGDPADVMARCLLYHLDDPGSHSRNRLRWYHRGKLAALAATFDITHPDHPDSVDDTIADYDSWLQCLVSGADTSYDPSLVCLVAGELKQYARGEV